MNPVAIVIAGILLSGCAALREPQQPQPKFLPVEIISELSGLGCDIRKFSYSQSQRGEQTLVECK